jgi:hypothetical protein
MTLINYFPGCLVGLGDPASLTPSPFIPLRLKHAWVDYLNDYVFWWGGGMAFHDFLSEIVLNRLGRENCIYIRGRSPSNIAFVDIVYHDRYIEIETGLKHSYNALIKRLRASHNWVYVIVPNASVKSDYRVSLPRFHGRLYTLKEFMSLSSY